MTAGGHIITLVDGKWPKTYIIGEAERDKAIQILARKLKHPLTPLPDLQPVSAEILKDHGIKPGQAKRFHL
jgi:hypothetical protein